MGFTINPKPCLSRLTDASCYHRLRLRPAARLLPSPPRTASSASRAPFSLCGYQASVSRAPLRASTLVSAPSPVTKEDRCLEAGLPEPAGRLPQASAPVGGWHGVQPPTRPAWGQACLMPGSQVSQRGRNKLMRPSRDSDISELRDPRGERDRESSEEGRRQSCSLSPRGLGRQALPSPHPPPSACFLSVPGFCPLHSTSEPSR